MGHATSQHLRNVAVAAANLYHSHGRLEKGEYELQFVIALYRIGDVHLGQVAFLGRAIVPK